MSRKLGNFHPGIEGGKGSTLGSEKLVFLVVNYPKNLIFFFGAEYPKIFAAFGTKYFLKNLFFLVLNIPKKPDFLGA